MITEEDIPIIAEIRREAARFKGLADIAKVGGAGRAAIEHASCARILNAMLTTYDRVLREVNSPAPTQQTLPPAQQNGKRR